MGRRGGHAAARSSYTQLASCTEALCQPAMQHGVKAPGCAPRWLRGHQAVLTRRSQRSSLLLERSRRIPSSHRGPSWISSRGRLLVLLVVHALLRVLLLLLRWPATLRGLSHLAVHIAIAGLLPISPPGILLVVVAVIPLLVASLIVCVVIILLVLLTVIARGLVSSLLRAGLVTMLLPRLRVVVVLLLLVCHGVFGALGSHRRGAHKASDVW
jgi:hypothetical protein